MKTTDHLQVNKSNRMYSLRKARLEIETAQDPKSKILTNLI